MKTRTKHLFIFFLAAIPFAVNAQAQRTVYNAKRGWKTDAEDRHTSASSAQLARVISAFDRISIEGAFDVYLYSGTEDSIYIQAPAKQLDDIITKVENGKLRVKMKKGSWMKKGSRNYNGYSKRIIRIPVREISELSLSGSGNISTQDLDLNNNDLSIKSSGSGNITVSVACDYLQLQNSGSGMLSLSGKTNRLNLAMSGSGNVAMETLQAQSSAVKLSGSGVAKINSQKDLNVQLSGSGRVRYKFYDNLVLTSKTTGSGSIRSY